MNNRIVLALLAVAASACGGKDKRAGKGELTVEWLGSDTGGLSTTPRAVWCASDSILKIIATKGEDGVGVALFPTEAPGPGIYAVFDPMADSTQRVRPGVTVASRWVDDKTVVAYQSDSGSLNVSQEPNGLAGTFTVRMHGVNTSDTVRMTGHFGGITPGPCPTDPTPAKAPGQ